MKRETFQLFYILVRFQYHELKGKVKRIIPSQLLGATPFFWRPSPVSVKFSNFMPVHNPGHKLTDFWKTPPFPPPQRCACEGQAVCVHKSWCPGSVTPTPGFTVPSTPLRGEGGMATPFLIGPAHYLNSGFSSNLVQQFGRKLYLHKKLINLGWGRPVSS